MHDTKAPQRAPMHTLAEVAETMGLAKGLKGPERFLVRQILAGRIRARKVGRSWMMTDADVAFALEQFANELAAAPTSIPDGSPVGAPSAASMRRRRSA